MKFGTLSKPPEPCQVLGCVAAQRQDLGHCRAVISSGVGKPRNASLAQRLIVAVKPRLDESTVVEHTEPAWSGELLPQASRQGRVGLTDVQDEVEVFVRRRAYVGEDDHDHLFDM